MLSIHIEYINTFNVLHVIVLNFPKVDIYKYIYTFLKTKNCFYYNQWH